MYGTAIQCNTTTTFNFDNSVWMVVFSGQIAEYTPNDGGTGAICIAFYKGNNMTVQIGVGGGIGNGGFNGGGKTIVKTNFAVPDGYEPGLRDAIASGAGAGEGVAAFGTHWYTNIDGTFKGWYGESRAATFSAMNRDPMARQFGTAASQLAGGWNASGERRSSSGVVGGGGGYFDGGGSPVMYYSNEDKKIGLTNMGGGGSCTPWCYPLQASDVDNGVRLGTGNGWVSFYGIDPTVMPSGAEVNLAGDPEATAAVTAGSVVGAWTPVSAVKSISGSLTSYNCGIETGWVFR